MWSNCTASGADPGRSAAVTTRVPRATAVLEAMRTAEALRGAAATEREAVRGEAKAVRCMMRAMLFEERIARLNMNGNACKGGTVQQ